jgi:hypothetical protein
MRKSVELKIIEPIYSTYHYQGCAGAIIADNPSIRNWYLNNAVILQCDRNFLHGKNSPEVSVKDSWGWSNPCIEKKPFFPQFLGNSTNAVIRNLLDAGYYVNFIGVDDYYIEGKSWYQEKHFSHDCLICGYDQEEKTYSLYAYDKSWVYRVFKTSQKSFEAGRKAEIEKENYGIFWAYKPLKDEVKLAPKIIYKKIKEYLDSSLDQYPENINGMVYGVAVYDYIAIYLNKLFDGSIPYEKMDKRIFRLIWEHKKAMLERICAVEELLTMGHAVSDKYGELVKKADDMRMMYASHYIKRRDSVLPLIREKLIDLKEDEINILNVFISKMEECQK